MKFRKKRPERSVTSPAFLYTRILPDQIPPDQKGPDSNELDKDEFIRCDVIKNSSLSDFQVNIVGSHGACDGAVHLFRSQV